MIISAPVVLLISQQLRGKVGAVCGEGSKDGGGVYHDGVVGRQLGL